MPGMFSLSVNSIISKVDLTVSPIKRSFELSIKTNPKDLSSVGNPSPDGHG